MARKFLTGGSNVNVGPLAALSGASAITLTMWIKLSDASRDMTLVLRGPNFVSDAPLLLWRDANAAISGRSNTISSIVTTNVGSLRLEGSTNVVNDTTDWHHLALVFEANSSEGLRLYVDGIKDSHPTSTVGHSQLVVNTSDVTLGFATASLELLGELAEFAAWNESLSDQEISQLASGPSTLTLPGAIGRVVCYHDLIRTLNRPGIGDVASSSGSFDISEHPRLLFPKSPLPSISSAQSLIEGPHFPEQAELQLATLTAGEAFLPGIAAGNITPTGEIHS